VTQCDGSLPGPVIAWGAECASIADAAGQIRQSTFKALQIRHGFSIYRAEVRHEQFPSSVRIPCFVESDRLGSDRCIGLVRCIQAQQKGAGCA